MASQGNLLPAHGLELVEVERARAVSVGQAHELLTVVKVELCPRRDLECHLERILSRGSERGNSTCKFEYSVLKA